jgi:hypothetical protein
VARLHRGVAQSLGDRDAVSASPVPTLKRIIDGVPTGPDTPPELTGNYYALATSMIEYVYATYGPQSYWDLVALYKDNPDYRVNYPKVFKVEPEAFYQSWLAPRKRSTAEAYVRQSNNRAVRLRASSQP